MEQFFKSVLGSDPSFSLNQEIYQKIDVIRDLYSHAIKMQTNPRCFLYYVTTGEWHDAPEPRARLQDGKDRLGRLNLFSETSVLPVDSTYLKENYRELERSVVKEVEFIRTAAFPRIDRVGEAYIGLLPGDEFINLVTTNEGELNRELFFDNVRDFPRA